MVSTDQLESARVAFGVALGVSNVAVLIGVALENKIFSEKTQGLGWRILLCGLAIEASLAFMLLATDTEISNRYKNALAQADANLLAEQRLTARERMRLERLERIDLPRSVWLKPAAMVRALKEGKFPPVNIAIVDRPESRAYGLDLVQIFQDAGLLAGLTWLPKDAEVQGVVMVAIDPEGARLDALLWQRFQIAGGMFGAKPGATAIPGLPHGIPTDRNCLVVGDNDAAWQPMPGQPGEGLDVQGRPVPAPQ